MGKVKLFFGLYFVTIFFSYGQCAMCRIVAESNQEAGGTIANGLNTGILYLMVCPYILILFGLIWMYYRNKITTSN